METETLYIKKFQSYLTFDIINHQTHPRIANFLYKQKAFDLLKKYIAYDTNYNNNYETVLEHFYYEMIQVLGHEKAIQIINQHKKIDYVPPTIPKKTKAYLNHMTLEELQSEESSILQCMFKVLDNSGFFSANIQNFSQLLPRHDYVINRIHEVKRMTAPSWADEMDEIEDDDDDDNDIFMDSYEYLDDILEQEQEQKVEDSEAYKLWYCSH
jgi:hypothetical protein